MFKKTILWFLLVWLNNSMVDAQVVFPPRGIVFTDDAVPRIDISINKDSLMAMLDQSNIKSDHEYLANFIWDDGVRIDTMKNIGFRLRGNTSRYAAKKSFKIKFTAFDNKKFYGLSDLNLNGEHNDPSILRSKLNWDLMTMAGLEGPRANHVRLYINGEYRGLYVNVESIDDSYFKARKKDDRGQLFKCYYGADLTYKGNNPSNYNKSVYEAANHEDNPDIWALIDVLKILDKPSDPEFTCKLEQVMDVDNVLKRMAFEVLIGHWDNLIYNINNAYLYFNPTTHKMEILSYDLDNTYGIDWFGIDWTTRNIYSWSWTGKARPLYNNLMAVPEYKQRYSIYMKKMMDTFFNPTFMTSYTEQIKTRIAPYVINDQYASLDYGYTFEDFNNALVKAAGLHVKKGIIEFVKERHAAALSQLQIGPSSAYGVEHSIEWKGSQVTTVLKVEQVPTSVVMHYSLDSGSWQQMDMTGNDTKDYFVNEIDKAGATQMDYFFDVFSSNGKNKRFPICDTLIAKIGYLPTPALFINEYMADNEIIQDGSSEYEDWVELYNGSEEAIYLGDKYLSDNADQRDKWLLPSLDLEGHQFLLIWADEDGAQGFDHANFKLDKGGEFIGIFDSEENALAPIDTIRYENSQKNKSAGRWPDGGALFPILSSPTPGASNVVNATKNMAYTEVQLKPTFVNDRIIINSPKPFKKIIISNSNGLPCKVIEGVHNECIVDVSELLSDHYFVLVYFHDGIMVKRFYRR